MDLPEEVGYGTITGRILVAVRDEDDLNLAPDGAPVRGQAVFTPSIDYATVDSATTGPQTIAFAPIIGVFDDQGYLSTPHPKSGQVMYRGLNLVATDDPDLSVTGWTWKVTYQLEAVAGKKLAIPEHSFEVPVGSSLDLAELVPVPSTPGYGLPQAEAAALRAEAVAQSVRDDADSGLFNGTAATVEVGTVTNGLNPSVTNSGTDSHAVLNFVLAKGDKGDTGVGLPDAGTPLQVMRMAESGAQTEWVSPDKNMVGLGNVDNTTDLDKPVSNATQAALNLKASTADLAAGLSGKADLQSGKVPLAQLPTDALVTDANVAAQVNGAQTSAAIDARINTQVTPVVEQIAADYIASDPAVVDAAAAAVDANPKIATLEQKNTSQDEKITTLRSDVDGQADRIAESSFIVQDSNGSQIFAVDDLLDRPHFRGTDPVAGEVRDRTSKSVEFQDELGHVIYAIDDVDSSPHFRGSNGATGFTETHFIILAGQSNAVGVVGPSPVGTNDPLPNLFMIPQRGTGVGVEVQAVEPIAHPYNNPAAGSAGHGWTVARQYAVERPGVRVVILPMAMAGSGFFYSSSPTYTWAPSRVGEAGTNNLYEFAIQKCNSAISGYEGTKRVAMILWHQGEADAVGLTTQAQYEAEFQSLISGFRTLIEGASDAIVIVGQLGWEFRNVRAPGSWAEIDAAHQNIPAIITGSAFAPSPPQGHMEADNTHFTGLGQKLLAESITGVLRDAYYNNSLGA